MSDTSFLFANPSFLEGIARVIDLGSTLDEYNRSLTPEQADYFAIRSDWELIGEDIFTTIESEKKNKDVESEQIELKFDKE